MPVTIVVHKDDRWGGDPFVEIRCPHCGSSLADVKGWPANCWYCNHKLPRMYHYFKKRKVARFHYYKNWRTEKNVNTIKERLDKSLQSTESSVW